MEAPKLRPHIYYLFSFPSNEKRRDAVAYLFGRRDAGLMPTFKNQEIVCMQENHDTLLAITFKGGINFKRATAVFPPLSGVVVVTSVTTLDTEGNAADGSDFYKKGRKFSVGVYHFFKTPPSMKLCRAMAAELTAVATEGIQKEMVDLNSKNAQETEELRIQLHAKEAEVVALRNKIQALEEPIADFVTKLQEKISNRRSGRKRVKGTVKVCSGKAVKPFLRVNKEGNCLLDCASWQMSPETSSVAQRADHNQFLRDCTGDAMKIPENQVATMLGAAICLYEAPKEFSPDDDDDEFYDGGLFGELQLLATEDSTNTQVANEAQVQCYIDYVRSKNYYFEEISIFFLNTFVLQKMDPPWSILRVREAPDSGIMHMNPHTVYVTNEPKSTYSYFMIIHFSYISNIFLRIYILHALFNIYVIHMIN